MILLINLQKWIKVQEIYRFMLHTPTSVLLTDEQRGQMVRECLAEMITAARERQ